MHILHEIHHFGLGSTGAVYHTVNLFPVLVKHLLDYRDIRTGRRQYQFPGINAQSGNFVCQFTFSGVNEFFRNGVVIALRVFLRQIFGKYDVTGRS